MASVTGVMGVSFLVVFANCLVSDHLLIMRDKGLGFMKSFAEATGKRLAALAAAVALIAVAGGVVMLAGGRASHSDMRVAMVQSCINPWDNWSINRMHYLQELTRLTNRALDQNPDMLVWSESATLELISHSFQTGRLNSFERQLFDFVARVGKPLLTGEIGRSYNMARFEPRFHNSAVLIDGAGNVVRSYYKINLVPFGEWFPYERWFPWVSRLVQSFGASSFSPGSGPVRFEALGRKFGVLICYEGIFFRLCRQYKRLGVDFLVNITNDGWTDTYNGHMQHYAASKFRAIENGLWLLRAGNTGYTVFIDPYGRETASIPILHKGYLVGSMDFTLNHATFYSIAGDAFFYLVAAFVGGLLLLLARRRMHER
jgi:apolipoprotein N-acyltransferase